MMLPIILEEAEHVARHSFRSRVKTGRWILSAARFVGESPSQRFRSQKILVYLLHSEMVARFQQPVAAMILPHRLDFDTDYNTHGVRIFL